MSSDPAARSNRPRRAQQRSTSMSKNRWMWTAAACAMSSVLCAALPPAAQKLEDQLVIATTGGLMGNALAKYFYDPFNKAKKVEVVQVAIEVPDQLARAKAMQRTGKIEFE